MKLHIYTAIDWSGNLYSDQGESTATTLRGLKRLLSGQPYPNSSSHYVGVVTEPSFGLGANELERWGSENGVTIRACYR